MTEFMKLNGFAELDQQLRQFPILLQEDILRKALVQGAKVYQEFAQAKAPVGTVPHRDKKMRMEQPGTGKASIKIRKIKESADASVRYAVGIFKRGWYMRLIETGWTPTGPRKKGTTFAKHRHEASKNNQKVAGRPFLEPSYQTVTHTVIDTVARTIKIWIQKYKTPRKRTRSA